MKKSFAHFTLSLLTLFLFVNAGYCLSPEEIIRLKAAGIDDATIQTIISEKIIETCAFNVDEIVKLKDAGLTNATVQSVIKNASFMKDTGTIEYGKDIRQIRSVTIQDIIELKNAGISDEVIKAVMSGTRDELDEDEERAWEMLEKMGIIVDER